MKDNSTEQFIYSLSERIVKAQQPIRVLDAIQWDNTIQAAFFKNKCKKLPPVDLSYYARHPLRFDPSKKIQELYKIEDDVNRKLGQYSAISTLMRERCQEYREVVHFLKSRGTTEFSRLSKNLYGSAKDAFYTGAPNLCDLCATVSHVLDKIDEKKEKRKNKKTYTAEEAVSILETRLRKYFRKDKNIHVTVSDDIIADAAAGADTIKLRADLKFNKRNIKLYEVHEGWVHLGTTLNGLSQPYCTFLSKGPPSALVIQEGLAMLTEIFTFSSYPSRVRRLTARIIAIDKAENGADFIDIFNFFREQGIGDIESYQNSVRVFRGSQPNLGPFTKDLAYTKGFVLIASYIRLAAEKGCLSHIPLLFTGKINLSHLHLLAELLEEGILKKPLYVPPPFRDTSALSAWSSVSLFINQLDLKQLEEDYRNIM